MKKMKLLTFLTALVYVLTLCATVIAEKVPFDFWDAAEELVLQTSNVTVEGKAEFRLDGVLFKTAEGTYAQDYDNSYMRLKLHTPRKNDVIQDTGYTVINRNGDVLAQEDLTAATVGWKWHYTAPSDTILGNSVRMRQVLKICRFTADTLGLLPAEKISVTEDADGTTLKISMDAEDGKGLVDLALNAVYQYVGDHFFHIGYDTMETYSGWCSIDQYTTVTDGLKYALREISLKNADVTVTLDENGQLKAVNGTVALTVTERSSTERELSITFEGKVSDRGGSSIYEYIPDEVKEMLINSRFGEEIPEMEAENKWDAGTVRVIRWTHEGEAPETYLISDGQTVMQLMDAYMCMNPCEPVSEVTEDARDIITLYRENGTAVTGIFDNGNLLVEGVPYTMTDPMDFWTMLQNLCRDVPPADDTQMTGYVPFEDTLPGINVTNEEEAVRFARAVWAMDCVRTEVPEDAVWTAEKLDEGRWKVTAQWGGEGREQTLTLILANYGTCLELLDNGACGLKDAEPHVFTEEEGCDTNRESYRAMMNLAGERASELLAPGSTQNYLTHYLSPSSNMWFGSFYDEYRNGDSRFLDYYCEKMFGDGETRTRFIVQYAPEIRIVYFNTKVPLTEGGNG